MSKQKALWGLGLTIALFLLTTITCWKVLNDPSQVLAFNDGNIEAMLSPIYQFPAALQRIWVNDFFFGLGTKQASLTVTSLGESIGPVFWRTWGQPVVLMLCGLAFYWMLRQYRLGRVASGITALILVGCGYWNNFAMLGLAVRPVASACAALALGFIEQGRASGRWLPYALAGGCLGLGIAEVPDVGVLLAITTAVVFVWTHLLGKCESKNVKLEAKTEEAKAVVTVFGLLGKFLLYVAFSALLAWQTISSIFSTNIQGVTQGAEESPAARYAWATQWSIPVAETWNIVAGTYFGSSMRSETNPYWGRLGRDENWEQTHQGYRNFMTTNWHLGVIPCILLLTYLIFALRARPESWPRRGTDTSGLTQESGGNPPTVVFTRGFGLMLLVGLALSLMLMWGKYFPLYHWFWSLPYFGTFRNPEKWNSPFVLLAGIGIAIMLDILWRALTTQGKSRSHQPLAISPLPAASSLRPLLSSSCLWAGGSLAVLAGLILVGTLSDKTAFIAARLSEGYAEQAALMWDNAIGACFKVLILSVVFYGLIYFFLGKPGASSVSNHRAWWVLSSLTLLSLGDIYCNNQPVILGHHYQQFLQPNPLTDFLDAHRTEGRIKLMPPRHPLLNNLRLTLLFIKGYDLFDPVSVSRMPTDYAALFQALEKHPIRLWELGAMRYFLTLPGAVDELNKLDHDRGRFVERLALGVGVVNGSYVPVTSADAQQNILRLLEFTGALPKYHFAGRITAVPAEAEGDRQALARLGADDFRPANETLIHANASAADLAACGTGRITVLAEGPAEVKLEVETTAPAWLFRSVKFDPDWKVAIDGQPVDLLRANFLFQAVQTPTGRHILDFCYRPSSRSTWFALATKISLVLLLIVGCWSEGQKANESTES